MAIRWAADDINLYELARSDGSPLPSVEPGSHFDLHLPNGITRQYSVINATSATTSYVIGIKLDPESRGGSRHVFDELKAGQVLAISQPRNHFALAPDASHHVLIAGGIGITPIYSMVRKLRSDGASFELHYAARTRSQLAFLDDLAEAPYSHIHCDDEHEGVLLDLAGIVSQAPEGSHFYCCGPTPMMDAFSAATEGIPSGRIHLEHFSPVAEADTSGGYIVEIASSGQQIPIPEGKSILETLREKGFDLPSSCEEGVCGTCETRVIDGVPEHRDSVLLEEERAANNTMMICCSGSRSDRLLLDL